MEKVCTSVISFFILSGGTAAAEVLIRGEGIVCVCVCVCVSHLFIFDLQCGEARLQLLESEEELGLHLWQCCDLTHLEYQHA